MKDLTLKKEEKKDFILNIIKEKDSEQDTLKVIYADGGYNKLVENTQKNIKLAGNVINTLPDDFSGDIVNITVRSIEGTERNVIRM